MRKRRTDTDEGLTAINELEARIVRAHDEKIAFGISAEEIARLRPGVVALAAAVANQLRAEYRARSHQS